MLLYRVGFWAKLLASLTDSSTKADFGKSSVLLTGFGTQKVVEYIVLDISVECLKGMFWSQFILKDQGGKEFKLGGVPNRVSLGFKKEIESLISISVKGMFKKHKDFIGEADKKLYQISIGQRYLRYSQYNDWLKKYLSLAPLFIRKDRDEFVESKLRNSIEVSHSAFLKPTEFRKKRNSLFINKELDRFEDFFNSIESNPLTLSQRRACVENDDNNLILAGAGTGKTSTLIAKVGYLINSEQINPEEILMLAYGKDAAKEMSERLSEKLGFSNLTVKTFHGLGLEIIAQVEQKKPSLSPLAGDTKNFEKFIDITVDDLVKNKVYLNELINYFSNYLFPAKNSLGFSSQKEYISYCLESELRSLKGDQVKSLEELKIANFLYRNGINYQYEGRYKVDTASSDYRRYCPDFYLEDFEIYLEHFGIDRNGDPAPFVDKVKYQEGIEWKRKVHTLNQTILLESYSYEEREGRLLKNLEKKLKQHGVIFLPLKNSQLLMQLREKGEVRVFSKLMAVVLSLFKLSDLTMQRVLEMASTHAEEARMKAGIKLFQPIYEIYQKYLYQNNDIDFEDMINKAMSYVLNGEFQSPYKYILVDEFQDISSSRAQLIYELVSQRKLNSLFCVGDDWQSIYKFAGSDVSITSGFEKRFGHTATNVLDMTFRFNNRIGSAASSFIQKNPYQLKKDIKSCRKVKNTAISLIGTSNDEDGLVEALQQISSKAIEGSSVLVLARFHFLNKDLNVVVGAFPSLSIKFMSVHGSKGKEADYVVIVGLNKGKYGFPSEKATHPLISMLLPKEGSFHFAEERRLFYVALTRAKNHVYLVSNPKKASSFIKELRKGEYDIEAISSDIGSVEWADSVQCPNCEIGHIVQRSGSNGKFSACNNYPYCKYTENGCKRCGGIVKKSGRFAICNSKDCEYVTPMCLSCNGHMALRSSSHGRFWGCSNFKGDSPDSCSKTEKFIDLARAVNDSNASY